MPKLDDFIKNGTPLGIALGVGAAVLASAVIPLLPAIAQAARPTARAAIKSGILLVERGREFMAEASEEIEDIVAEAKAELRKDNQMRQDDFKDRKEDSAGRDES